MVCRSYIHVVNTVLIFFFFLGLMNCTSGKDTPPLIDDRASLLTDTGKSRITDYCAHLAAELDIRITVTTLDAAVGDIDATAARLFSERSEGGARRVLFLIDPAGRQVRLEIGYDLEGIYTDGFVGYIERKQMVPFFESGAVGDGIAATIELLVDKALGTAASERGELTTEANDTSPYYSGGAGAVTSVDIGTGRSAPAPAAQANDYGAQPSPLAALDTYRRILAAHVKDPDLGLYTPATRTFFRTHTVTDAQQDNARTLLDRIAGTERIVIRDDHAVIHYPLHNRRANPYFLQRGPYGWMMDFVSMNRFIRFNHLNQWHFASTDHPYMFAFDGVTIDTQGFPHAR